MIDVMTERDRRLHVLDRSFWRLVGRADIYNKMGMPMRAMRVLNAANRVHRWERELRLAPVAQLQKKGVDHGA